MDSKEKLISDCIKAVCVNGEDLKKFKPDIDGIGLYEKCEKFVAVFRELKGIGQLSNVAANKLRFQGKQIGLTEDTIKMLTDVLEGKAEPIPEKSDVPSTDIPEDKSLLIREIPVEKTIPVKKTLVPIKLKEDWLRTLKRVDVKKYWSDVSGFVKTNKKWIIGMAAVVVVLIGIMLIPFGENLPQNDQEQIYKKLSAAFELSTIEYHVNIVHYERDPRKVRQDKVIAIVTPAKVIAGIDMSLLSEKDVTISGNSIELRLPKAKLMGVEIEREKMVVVTYPKENSYNVKEISDAKTQAQEELEKQILDYPILNDAQEHAGQLFRSLLEHLGYATITINFV
jgi:hypothetical protein